MSKEMENSIVGELEKEIARHRWAYASIQADARKAREEGEQASLSFCYALALVGTEEDIRRADDVAALRAELGRLREEVPRELKRMQEQYLKMSHAEMTARLSQMREALLSHCCGCRDSVPLIGEHHVTKLRVGSEGRMRCRLTEAMRAALGATTDEPGQ